MSALEIVTKIKNESIRIEANGSTIHARMEILKFLTDDLRDCLERVDMSDLPKEDILCARAIFEQIDDIGERLDAIDRIIDEDESSDLAFYYEVERE